MFLLCKHLHCTLIDYTGSRNNINSSDRFLRNMLLLFKPLLLKNRVVASIFFNFIFHRFHLSG